MGILDHFCQTSATPTPVSHEYQRGNIAQFSASFSLSLPEGRQIVFGDDTKFCSSKKAARTIAAQEAVLCLRGEGLLPNTSVSAGPQRTCTSLSTSLVRHTPPSTTTSSLVDNRTTLHPTPQVDPSSREITAQILALCKLLGLSQPIYQHKPSFLDTTPHWVNSAAFFPGSTDLQGPIGSVERIFGKKNAKEECAKRVLIVLEELKAKRTAGIRALEDGQH